MILEELLNYQKKSALERFKTTKERLKFHKKDISVKNIIDNLDYEGLNVGTYVKMKEYLRELFQLAYLREGYVNVNQLVETKIIQLRINENKSN